jgi:hypothetical protein
MEAIRADPHLEEVAGYLSLVRRRTVLELAPPLGGFVATVALVPDRWLRLTALYVGISCAFGLLRFLSTWRKLLPRIRAAPPVPPDAVEVKRRPLGLRTVFALLLEVGFLLGCGRLWAALADSSFASGLLFAAVLLSAGAVEDVATRWSLGRWEHRNGRVLTSLLLGKGEVFYVDRDAHAA